uniref:PhlE n=1 Tax=Pseudomonas fluorescens TaxID=294 RepID=Q75V73_PSEFL|nr:PhlE [Pseudomonas fluorescens]
MEGKYLAARPWGGYERRMVVLLSLSFGLVGLDRFIIMPLFPVIMRDLALDYQDLSLLSAILAFAWGGSALFMGAAMRLLGTKQLLVLSITLLSLLPGASALITSLVGLVLLRALMGVCEGAFTPVSIIVTDEVSQPCRRGLNLGIQQALFPIIGLCLGPLLAGVLLEFFGSWRAVFAIISLPGLLVAWYLYRSYQPAQGPHTPPIDRPTHSQWRTALASGNVRLNIALMLCILTCQFVLCALLPSYLTDILHLSDFSMAMIISAIGLGGFFGQVGHSRAVRPTGSQARRFRLLHAQCTAGGPAHRQPALAVAAVPPVVLPVLHQLQPDLHHRRAADQRIGATQLAGHRDGPGGGLRRDSGRWRRARGRRLHRNELGTDCHPVPGAGRQPDRRVAVVAAQGSQPCVRRARRLQPPTRSLDPGG